MRLTMLVALLAATIAAPGTGRAQRVQSWADLPLRVNRDDLVRVVDRAGVKSIGRVVAFGRDSLTIAMGGASSQFAESAVRRVDRSGSSTARGALIGAGAMLVFGLVGCPEDSADGCPVFTALLLGAPAGALAGAWIPSMREVYRAPAIPAPTRAVAAAGDAASLKRDLGLAVNLGDRVSVEMASGETVTGILAWLEDEGFGFSATDDVGARSFTRQSVRRVSLTRSRRKLGTLLGFVAFSALCAPSAGSDWVDALLLCGGPGAGIGALVGNGIRSSTVVYPAQPLRLTVAPALVHHRLGVRAIYRF